MNDSERVKVADVIETELDSYCPSPFNGAFAVSLMQIIDRLLADRAVPEPDAAGDDLDAMLDSVPSPDHIQLGFAGSEGDRIVDLVYAAGGDEYGNVEWRRVEGTGPTRKAAVLEAVAKANGAGDAGPTS